MGTLHCLLLLLRVSGVVWRMEGDGVEALGVYLLMLDGVLER